MKAFRMFTNFKTTVIFFFLSDLSRCHNRKISKIRLHTKRNLHSDSRTDKVTLLLELETDGISYEPGDHVGVFPCNRTELVDGIIKHLGEGNPDKSVELQLLKEKQTSTGTCRIIFIAIVVRRQRGIFKSRKSKSI